MQTQIAPNDQQAASQVGMVDVEQIISEIKMPPSLKDMYEKAVISGMRVMFDKRSHKMLLDQLDQPGELDDKISSGIITLIYIIWGESNHTLPPPIIVPLAITLTLKAFDFLQKSGEPGATKEILGSALQKATHGTLSKFGVSEDQLKQFIEQNRQVAQDGGMTANMGGSNGL